MQGWPSALVVATGASALFAFGIIQSAFAPQAQALFIVFAAVLLLIMLAKRVFGHTAHGHGHGHGHGADHAVVMSGRTVGMVTVGAAMLAGLFFWTSNDLNAEKIGREIDRGAAGLGRQAEVTFARFTGGADKTIPDEQEEASLVQ
jgi:hypothetical protein